MALNVQDKSSIYICFILIMVQSLFDRFDIILKYILFCCVVGFRFYRKLKCITGINANLTRIKNSNDGH